MKFTHPTLFFDFKKTAAPLSRVPFSFIAFAIVIPLFLGITHHVVVVHSDIARGILANTVGKTELASVIQTIQWTLATAAGGALVLMVAGGLLSIFFLYRSEAAYLRYLAHYDVDSLSRYAKGLETDDDSRNLVVRYLNKTRPGWSYA